MTESTSAEEGKPHVLMAPYTYLPDIIDLHDVLTKEFGCEVSIRSKSEITETSGPYDLVIQMGLDAEEKKELGLEYLRLLRQKFGSTPILVISGHDASYALEEVLEHGATDFLARKHEPHEFIRKVKELLQTKTAAL